MKQLLKTVFSATAILALILGQTGCQKETMAPKGSSQPDVELMGKKDNSKSDNSMVFPVQAHMYGKSYEQWSQEWWKWALNFDCSHFPIFDATGSLQNQNQSGNVFFLSGQRGHTDKTTGKFIGSTLNVTIPAGVSIFVPALTFYQDLDCDSANLPRPTNLKVIDSILTAHAIDYNNAFGNTTLTIDGQDINTSSYKLISPMFTSTANAQLADATACDYDECLTGGPQQFVVGGYFFMLKPLCRGNHTIHRYGSAFGGAYQADITYKITQK